MDFPGEIRDCEELTSTSSRNSDIDSLRKKRTDVMESAIRKHFSNAPDSLDPNKRPPPQQAVMILADAMLNSPDDEKLQFKAIVSLVRMSAKDEEREFIGQSDCIKATIIAMDSFSTNRSLVAKGCIFLANAAFECEMNKETVRKHGGIGMIIRQASKRDGDENLQLWTFLALRNLTNNSIENQTEADSAGVAELLQKGLSKFGENRSLQTHGVASIANVAQGGSHCQMRLGESGCLMVLVSSMKRNLMSCVFVEHCLFAVTALSSENEMNQLRFWKLGIVEILADIMEGTRLTPDLLLKICHAVRQLCFCKKIRGDAGRAGLVNHILEEQEDIRLHHGAKGAEAVLNALSNAVCDEEENMKIFTRCGGTEAMMKVLRENLGNVEVVIAGLRLFRNICDETGVNYEYMKGSGVFKFSLDCVTLFRDDTDITEHTFVLVSKVWTRGLKDNLFGRSVTDIAELIRSQLERHQSCDAVQKAGGTLLPAVEAEEPELHPSLMRRRSSLLIGKLRRKLSNAV